MCLNFSEGTFELQTGWLQLYGPVFSGSSTRLHALQVLRNMDVAMTGFREAVLVEGAAALRPLIDGCIIRRAPWTSRVKLARIGILKSSKVVLAQVCMPQKATSHNLLGDCARSASAYSFAVSLQAPVTMLACWYVLSVATLLTVRTELRACSVRRCSGDDAVNIAGSAAPLFRGCKLQAKKCGVRAFDSARGAFDGCKVEECGEQGVKLMEGASLTFSRCRR